MSLLTTLTANSTPLGKISGFNQGITRPFTDAPSRFTSILSNIIAIITIFAGLSFLIYFIIGGLTWITGGDAQQLEKAKKQMSSAIIGLILVILTIPISYLISKFTGLDILNIGQIINNLKFNPGP